VAEVKVDIPIPDADSIGVSHSLTLPGSAILQELQVAVKIEHPAVEQLAVSLTSPDGATVLLHNRTVSNMVPFSPIYETQNASAQSLSTFLGKNGQGAWTLRIVDAVGGATGVFVGWGLRVNPASLLTPPPPAALPLHADSFAEISRWNAEMVISNIAVADMNGDRWDDLILLSEIDGLVSVYLANGQGQFSAPMMYDVDRPLAIATADFNRDNHLDFVTASQIPQFPVSNLVVFLANTSGGYDLTYISDIPTNVDAITVFDGNYDGYLDIVLGGEPLILIGNGDGAFQSAQVLMWNGRSLLTHGDLNRDGAEDFLILKTRGTSPNAKPYLLFGNDAREKELSLNGTPLQSFTANLHEANTNEFVVVAASDTNDSTLWLTMISGSTIESIEINAIRLPDTLLNLPIAPYDLNNDGLTDLIFPTESGISAFQRTDDPNGGLSTQLVSIASPLMAKGGKFFADGAVGLVIVTALEEVILAKAAHGAHPTPTPTYLPVPSPTPFLFLTPSQPTNTPTPLPTTPPTARTPDLNSDGIVDHLDLLILMQHWGERYP
jgi:subtilisin-like proprotein convertase family protein